MRGARPWLNLALAGSVFVLGLARLGGWYLPLVIGCLLLMVLLHELGHFVTAKATGMQVTEFFVGFGPRLFSVRRGETEYGIKLLPLGGYVKITGMTMLEEVDPAVETRSFRAATFPRRVLVASAGSVVHLVLALLLAVVSLAVVGERNAASTQVEALSSWPGVTATPAHTAGLRAGDIFLTIDGRPVHSVTTVMHAIRPRVGDLLTVVVRRAGHAVTLRLRPVDARHVIVDGAPLAPAAGPPVGMVGVALTNPVEKVGVVAAVPKAGQLVWSTITSSVVSMVQVFSPHGLTALFQQATGATSATTPSAAANRPLSSVGVVRVAVQSAQAGLGPLLAILIAINVFVGLFNYLPILPLDGGHVAIAIYERLRSRRGRRYVADVAKMTPLVWAFLALLAFLFLSTFVLDLAHPLTNPFR
jgi:membrane-associated protease RseP (regulator of RpoE activity)